MWKAWKNAEKGASLWMKVCSVEGVEGLCSTQDMGWHMCLRLTYLDSLLQQPQRSYNARSGPGELCASFNDARRRRISRLAAPSLRIRRAGSAVNGAGCGERPGR